MYCLLPVLGCILIAVCCCSALFWSALFVVCCSLLVVCCLVYAVCSLLFVVWCLCWVARCLLLAVCDSLRLPGLGCRPIIACWRGLLQVAWRLLFVVCCSLFISVVSCLLISVGGLLSGVGGSLFAVRCLPFVACCPFLDVGWLLFGLPARCLLIVVSWLLLVDCC